MPRVPMQVQHVGIPAGHPQHPVRPAPDEQQRDARRDGREGQIARDDVPALERHCASVIQFAGELEHLLQPVHPRPE